MESRDRALCHLSEPSMQISLEIPTATGSGPHESQTSGAMVQELNSHFRTREIVAGGVLVFLIAVIGILLTAQGWRSHSPAHDLVPHIINAHELLTAGRIPVHGDTGSYGSYKPPGTAWLMLPSAVFFSDLRLVEYVGAGFLHLSTLAGIFLLAYEYFGFWCACLAVSIYGLSSTGIMLAASLWPNGRPEFFIWTVYFASRWVIRKDAKSLAIAAAIWGIGMNVDMAILPAIFIPVVLWFVYRPPIDFKLLIIATGLVLFVWFPYLRFEFGRGFADLRSQVFLQNIFPANYRQVWCDPNAPLRDLASTFDPTLASSQPQPYQLPNLVRAAVMLTNQITAKLLYNFQDAAPFPVICIAFLVIVLGSIILLNVTGDRLETNRILPSGPFWKDRRTRLGLAMILIGVANEFLIGRVLGVGGGLPFSSIGVLRTIEKLLVFGGASIVAGRSLVMIVDRVLSWARIQIQNKQHADDRGALVLCLAIPWLILLLVAEPGKPERFWWLWPLEALFIAAFIAWILPRLGMSRRLIWLISSGTTIIILWNPYVLDHVRAWRETGWSGIDAPAVQVVNYVTGDLDAEGKKQAAIGYHLFIYRFMAAYKITNPEYKVGMDFDLLFRYPHGITNTDQCAEGLSALDEYRIVQTKLQDGKGTPRLYFDVPLDRNFKLLRQFGPYQVFKRQ